MPASPRDLPVWTLAAASLQAGTPVALLCVVSSSGSSPGRQGFKMSVTADDLAGSIGGGIMEHKFIELARQRVQAGDSSPVLRPQIHRREAPTDRSGMMCSGEQDVLLWPLTAADLPTVAAIENALRMGARGRWSLRPDAGLQVQLAEPAASASSATLASGLPFYSYEPGPAWCYREQLGFRDHVTIIGGGHVSLALSNALALLDFELTVLDDRPDLLTLAANQAAHHRRVVSYEAIAAEIPSGPHQYVVVMTVGYRTDALVLRQLLSSPAGPAPYRYLGVMGSTAKVTELRRGLAEAGFPTAAIARLRGPIGLPIGSQTPEEIAVSIAAELIQARHAE
ncbi:XdhC family protein [Hymenobacter arizonensis]|uniref:Xanthine dehydrogenase accessory factor n=1 Tax=Hymenobacter arizonensis TaxID=1227077 RepID=A0A1I5ZYF5_HYMAR|nr:XdhC/CoxI family protein [Hymenobacter arizonensis]SFQ61519.1 xanthine dehydrogenase accessory factor [Hymenobacter arizonensis]